MQPTQRRFPFILAAGLLCLLAGLAFFTARLAWLDHSLSDDLSAFYSNPAYQSDLLLEAFPIYRQAYANSCGPTTLRMVYSYLDQPVSEQSFADKFGIPLGKSGILPGQFFQTMRRVLANDQTRHLTNLRDSALLEQIYRQLQRGIPVPIYFSTVNAWDVPNYDTHYSAIIGIRPAEKRVVIANAYGYQEELPISALLDAIKYRNFRGAPLDFRLGLFFGVIERNNLFWIAKQ